MRNRCSYAGLVSAYFSVYLAGTKNVEEIQFTLTGTPLLFFMATLKSIVALN